MRSYRILATTTILWLLADQLSKGWVKSETFREMTFIKDVFYLTRHQNQGIAFGIPLPLWIQIVISLGLIGMLFYLALNPYSLVPIPDLSPSQKKEFLKQALFGIILGGALGNLWDRVLTGSVIDFIKLVPFPVFNLADLGISLGIASLIIMLLIQNKNEQ